MGDCSGVDCMVKFTIDGIDEYKFSCPRNLQNSKAFEPLWRPKLHCIGLLVHGWVEYFAICDQDMLKNANLTLTVLSRGLDILWDDCRKHGLPLPQNFVCQGDNTCRENKNQYVLIYMGFLVATGVFNCSQMEFMPKGHTHNSLDQRFEVLNIILKKQEELQSPSMFKQMLEKQYSPVRGGSVAVELLDRTMDFAAWFESMGVSFSGLSATHTEKIPVMFGGWSGGQISAATAAVSFGMSTIAAMCGRIWSKTKGMPFYSSKSP